MIASFNRFALNITMAQAKACAHPGPCDADVMDLSRIRAIRKQIAKLDPTDLATELKEYGAWNEDELSNHEENIQRILWIACGDIVECEHERKRDREVRA